MDDFKEQISQIYATKDLDILFKVLKDDGVTPPIDINEQNTASKEETKVSS